MNAAFYFVLDALLTLVVIAFLLRWLMPLVRADFHNPFGEAILKFTNPLVLPLRKILRPTRRFDPASLLALLIVQFVKTTVLMLVRTGTVRGEALLMGGLLDLVVTVLQFYFYVLLVYALLSWFGSAAYSTAGQVLSRLCQPLLAPVRRVIPPIGGLDLSALFVMIALQAILIAIRTA